MVSFFKLLGIGYILAIMLLVWEIAMETFHKAATSYTLVFMITAFIGFIAFFLFVYFAPKE
ncbi:hypothetical protein BFU36_05600 [Sulfolobus sp. A20]|uniref:hypothetical protein n=1 Tax=Sulfolobaceae TaxID=118883 RepID=UPI000845C0D8|nr:MULTISPECIES: hypothetical protein [unclassified Sulfolobus]TRM77340.1 hypothetical protein DJ532_04700 [Sulfolobus sp. A20-N-F8]TRM79209.1 hypothetical protein DJ528_02350 [Sulfolobus sp. B5]TRM80185.1 hypothetical protein DJ531_12585 [Sulfolobus sp. A20-N-F6]TRM81041.1 hypothetical protein DJ524_05505 [Sulfolobus sp. D5]TRM83454.1 hypothetical protein DJ522_06240 [Sulfolobus sp. F3]TRM85040.1 hypothetical protein DJ521_07890 [Sulfolobus sp. E3]TRM88623.1 hypothetical protein DJ529_04705